MTATSVKLPADGGRMVSDTATAISCAYKAILDLCAPDRLHLQTIYAHHDNSPNVRILVTKRANGQTSTAFHTEFSAF